jgi:hypothetical protein
MKYSILITCVVFFNCTSTKTRNNNYANEIRAFEEQSWLSGKESYVNGEYVHPYEAAFLTNDIGMLDYFYEQAIIEGNARYARQLNQPYHLSKKVRERRIKNMKRALHLLGYGDPEFPVFTYRTKLMFAIFLEHAKKPECHESAIWLSKKPLLLRMSIHHMRGTMFSYSEAGSSSYSSKSTAREERARSIGTRLEQHDPEIYEGLPDELAKALIEQRILREAWRANFLTVNKRARRSNNEQKWVDEYNAGKRTPNEVPKRVAQEPTIIYLHRGVQTIYSPERQAAIKRIREKYLAE